MKIIPAIDIMGGKVVRLAQGDAKRQTVYSDSPEEVAQKWVSYGVDLIHVVDLDGALEGNLRNFDLIKNISKNLKAKIEMGGGIRDIDTIKQILDAGIEKVVIGTKALEDEFLKKIDDRSKDRVVVGIDAKDGMVYTKGWLTKTKTKAIDLAKRIADAGIKTINYTDIARDGMLEGPNIKSLKELLSAVSIDIVASGGVSNIEDVKRLKALEKDGLSGIIIGKALYENMIDLGEAIRA